MSRAKRISQLSDLFTREQALVSTTTRYNENTGPLAGLIVMGHEALQNGVACLYSTGLDTTVAGGSETRIINAIRGFSLWASVGLNRFLYVEEEIGRN
jgi:hypothetical protein